MPRAKGPISTGKRPPYFSGRSWDEIANDQKQENVTYLQIFNGEMIIHHENTELGYSLVFDEDQTDQIVSYILEHCGVDSISREFERAVDRLKSVFDR